jgi:hypothetical protein
LDSYLDIRHAATGPTPCILPGLLPVHEILKLSGISVTPNFAVGYESASQFNREYSRLFGNPPIRDIRSLRLHGESTM